MTPYTENPKGTTKKLLALISELGKVAGYKINTQKYVAFLYIHNELPERKIKETIPFTIISKNYKIPRDKPTYGGKRWVLKKL